MYIKVKPHMAFDKKNNNNKNNNCNNNNNNNFNNKNISTTHSYQWDSSLQIIEE